MPNRLGIRLESLGLPLRAALNEVSRLGVAGVQVDAVGDLAAERLSQTGRREFRHLLRSLSLEVTALGCPLRHSLDTAENQQPRIEYVCKTLALSYDLGAKIVIVDGPKAPQAAEPRGQLLREALNAIGSFGDRTGAALALETGLDSGETLAGYLATFDTGSLGVNYDPANMLLNGFDPIENLTPLRQWLKHVHARDAQKARVSKTAQETALGAGDIDWMTFVAMLETMEYRGWLVLERETGQNRLADVSNGVKFLRRFLR
ncbi:MAG TPA: sugar phosphate isomerase/epimerase family protein [Gemmataceae bacterium]|nr:sugar phosphate isomerase/epimerase family protein [Gemmataceae bacterium]